MDQQSQNFINNRLLEAIKEKNYALVLACMKADADPFHVNPSLSEVCAYDLAASTGFDEVVRLFNDGDISLNLRPVEKPLPITEKNTSNLV